MTQGRVILGQWSSDLGRHESRGLIQEEFAGHTKAPTTYTQQMR